MMLKRPTSSMCPMDRDRVESGDLPVELADADADRTGRGHGVDAHPRRRALHLPAGDDDLHRAGRAEPVAGPVTHAAVRCRAQVHAERHRRHRVVARSLGDHLLGPGLLVDGSSLLGGLEYEQDRAGQSVAQARQDRGGSHQHRGVTVVAAGVRDVERPAGVLHVHDGGGERLAGVLLDRQRVDVRAQRDHPLAGHASPEDTHHAVAGDPGADLVQVQRAQVGLDQPRRARLPIGQLRMPVDVVPPRDHLRLDVLGRRVDLGVDGITAHDSGLQAPDGTGKPEESGGASKKGAHPR